jgi:hypothetical protein
LIDVVLILTDAIRLGFDFYQFRQRILQAPRNGYRAPIRYIEIWKFFGRERRSGINGGARLADDETG